MSADVLNLIDRIAGSNVLCVGDVMLDRFVYGKVERISPEAPIPVLKIDHEDAMLGGAGNVVRNLSSLGAQVSFCGVLGDDDAGRDVDRLFAGLAGVTPYTIRNAGRPTSIKTRFLAGNQQMLRSDKEDVSPVSDALEKAIITSVETALPQADVVILSDYGKGVCSPNVLNWILEQARAAGKPVIVDPKGQDYSKYRGASVVTPNRAEIMAATQLGCDGDEGIVEAAHHLIKTCGIETVLATRSQDGMTLVEASGSVTHLPTEAREVFDVSGAGDTVVAALAVGLAAGGSLALSARLSNLAAGIVVGKVGTAAVYRDELRETALHQDISRAEARVLGLESARDQVENWKQRGLTVGFTNGCFDLLHPGHIALLDQARAQCDRLVVGLNSDASVKRLKGEERPLQSEAARATVLSSLSCVNTVVIFGDDTPINLISTLLPDVLVKGADYKVHEVVGGDVVQQNGGRVFLAELKDGFSTTNTVKKLKG